MAVTDHFRRSMESFLGKIKQHLFREVTPLPTWNYREAFYEGPGNIRYTTEWTTIDVNQTWYANTAFFQTQITLDSKHAGQPVYLRFDNQGECLFTLNGEPQQGFDPNRSLCLLSESGIAGTEYNLSVEASLRWQNLAHMVQGGVDYGTHVFKYASIVTINQNVYNLMLDLEVLYEYYLQTESDWAQALLNEARRVVKPDDEEHYFQEGVVHYLAWLSERWTEATNSAPGREITAVGHSHLDLAYLWPAKESVRKCGRTFSNMLQLLDRYPEFHFTQSQTMQYQWAKEHYPSLYERIKRYVGEGRWELMGGMLVEPDCNLISGESLIRQTIFGQKFYQDEFGITPDICWLPDTFGYPAYLPQVLSKSGFRYFYTGKINRNIVNIFPHNTFQWESPDGSKLVAALDMFNSYSAQMKIPEIQNGIKNFRNKKNIKDMMIVYGFGDGGGGVTSEMIERSDRYSKLPGMPKIKGGTAASYFSKLEAIREELPTWRGELYFEWHQGTYTSQAAAKKNNRRAELLYRNAELLLALQGADSAKLRDGWERLLFQQFHDILPGTSQAETFVTGAQEYQEIFRIGEKTAAEALMALTGLPAAAVQEAASIVLFNSLAFARTGWVECDLQIAEGQSVMDAVSGEPVEHRILPNGRTMIYAVNVPSVGYRRYDVVAVASATPASPDDVKVTEVGDLFVLENGELLLVVNRQTGFLDSVWDKRHRREVLSQSGKPGNVLEVFEELYDFYDAWNINEETLAAGGKLFDEAQSVELVTANASIAVIRVKKQVYRSVVVQDIVLKKYERKVDFQTQVDWKETGRLLKAGFDLDIRADRATYDMSFGHIERSTHNNTSWDRAQWEVCAHHWADLSERGYGVALLNDGKFGHDIKNGLMRITLLKAPKYPDTTCDIGQHNFTYSLYLHDGDWRAGRVDQEGWKFNAPLLAHPVGQGAVMPSEKSWLRLDSSGGVFLSALKPAEDGSGDWIVRVYENHGARTKVAIQLPMTSIHSAAECDMLENELHSLSYVGSTIPLELNPFEIKTIRIQHAVRNGE
ncbi:alpha-mannosidase [Paenibacillus roseipurpureus]|uniref:Glycoside hydrolase family 38 C-terminal domain-containing protein n=1 Tax=Paenibacillus roseopurpureus TaxID=2918901 RepID=A0AA96LWQ7_9BACL|nr:glycoside hydrolase family 38 C-terminal domain-containing protein [Paenibacillus sp. MBLB1832]WNR46075.1 glycoside hydrolase family 38 C-terminal domain-containing protein [Paenibacillus sp. MBLB1832]